MKRRHDNPLSWISKILLRYRPVRKLRVVSSKDEVIMTSHAREARRAKMRARFGDAVVDAHAHSSRHRAEIEASTSCGCFYCLRSFTPGEIRRWLGDGDESTALCPHCGIDSVLGDASGYEISVPFLTKMQWAWFSRW